MEHPCRHKVSFYMVNIFLSRGRGGGGVHTKINKYIYVFKIIRALQAQGFWMLSDTIRVLF